MGCNFLKVQIPGVKQVFFLKKYKHRGKKKILSKFGVKISEKEGFSTICSELVVQVHFLSKKQFF